MNNWKEKFKKNHERQQKKQKAKTKKYFDNERFGNKKHWKPTPIADLKMSDRRFLPKSFVYDDNLSLAAKALYPVMCCMSDFSELKPFQASHKNLGLRLGASPQTIAKAADELQEQKLIDKRKHKGEIYIYLAGFIRKGEIEDKAGEYISFHRCIVETGKWSRLTPRQQVLWLGLRVEGKVGDYVDQHIMYKVDDSCHNDAYEKWFKRREYDLWEGSRGKLCARIGIADVNIYKEVVRQLKWANMLEELPAQYWSKYNVFLVPKDLLTSYQKTYHYETVG